MGIDFTAIVDHSLALDELLELPRLLDAEWRREGSPLRSVRPHPSNPGAAWEWELSVGVANPELALIEDGRIDFDSPIGLWGSARRHALKINGLARWWSFVREPEVHDSLQAAVQTVARIVRGTTIIYLPDSSYRCSLAYDRLDEGLTVPDIVTWLRAECGPPAARASDIYVESGDDWSTDGYLVDSIESGALTRSGTG